MAYFDIALLAIIILLIISLAVNLKDKNKNKKFCQFSENGKHKWSKWELAKYTDTGDSYQVRCCVNCKICQRLTCWGIEYIG